MRNKIKEGLEKSLRRRRTGQDRKAAQDAAGTALPADLRAANHNLPVENAVSTCLTATRALELLAHCRYRRKQRMKSQNQPQKQGQERLRWRKSHWSKMTLMK